jgi:hypothetical protein
MIVPHERPNTWQHPITRSVCLEILLAPEGASTHGPFELSNNHGRIFGPFQFSGTYIFTGALSREKVDVLTSPMHQYESFNAARDDFAKNMDQATPYSLSGFVSMQNAIVGDPQITTGDHDGVAALLKAE